MARRLLAGAFAVLAVFGLPAAHAQCATASPSSSPSPSCSNGNLAVADLSGSPVSVKAGNAIVDSARLTDTTAATLTNASFILAVLPPPGVDSGKGTPELAWRVDGGSWHTFGLGWSAPADSGADWQSQVQYFGATFAPKASHTLDLRTEFTTASPSGNYQYEMAYSADPCGMQALGMNEEFSYYAQDVTQPKPTPSTPKPTPSASTHHAVPTSPSAGTHASAHAAAAPSPSPSPSRSVSPHASGSSSPATVLPPTPSAAGSASQGAVSTARSTTLTGTQDTAAPRSASGMSALVVALLAVVLLGGGGLYAGRRARRGGTDSADM